MHHVTASSLLQSLYLPVERNPKRGMKYTVARVVHAFGLDLRAEHLMCAGAYNTVAEATSSPDYVYMFAMAYKASPGRTLSVVRMPSGLIEYPDRATMIDCVRSLTMLAANSTLCDTDSVRIPNKGVAMLLMTCPTGEVEPENTVFHSKSLSIQAAVALLHDALIVNEHLVDWGPDANSGHYQ